MSLTNKFSQTLVTSELDEQPTFLSEGVVPDVDGFPVEAVIIG